MTSPGIANTPPALEKGSPARRKPGASSRALAKTVGSRVGWIVISGVTGMITARVLGPSGRGALAAMIMWPVFLAGVLTLGLPSALIYQITRAESTDRAGLFSAATLLSTAIGLAACAAGALVLPLWLSKYDAHVIRSAQWLMIFTVVSILMLVFRSAFEAIGNFGTSASTWLLGPVQTMIALILLWHFHRLTEVTAALSYVLAGLPIVVWMFLKLRQEFGWTTAGLGKSSKNLLNYGLRSYGIDLCGTLSQSVDQALVVGMISAADMGRYVVALSLSRTLNSVYQAAAAVLFPKCIGMTRYKAFVMALRVTIATTALAIPAAMILCICGSSLLRVLYGGDYVIATTLLQILTGEAILSGTTTLMSQTFMSMGRPGTVTVLQGAGLAITIPLLLYLVPLLGTIGAGIALVSTALLRLFLLISCYFIIARRLPRLQDFEKLGQGLRADAQVFVRMLSLPSSEIAR